MASLRKQSLLMAALTMVVFMVIGTAVSNYWMEHSLKDFELRDVQHSLSQTEQLLENQVLNLRKQARDYAVWDTTYDFMHNGDPDYAIKNYSDEIFTNLDSDFVLLLNNEGKVVLKLSQSRFSDRGNTPGISISESLRKQLQSVTRRGGTQFSGGLLWIDGRAFLYGLSSILDNEGDSASRGILIFARELSVERVAVLRSLARENFILRPLSIGMPLAKTAIQGDAIKTALILKDTDGKPTAELALDKQRPLLNQISTLKFIIILNALIITLLALGSVYFLFGRIVLRKIEILVQSISSTRLNPGKNSRITLQGNTDVDRIATEVNQLLDDLQYSYVQLQYDALHDHTTGLGNRKKLLQELDDICGILNSGTNQRSAILLMDLDNFRDINEIHGNVAGDHVLTTVSDRLSGYAYKNQSVYRTGGDEFAFIIPKFSERTPTHYAAHILSLVTQPIPYHNHLIHVRASIGIVIIDKSLGESIRPEDILRKANIAMRACKEQTFSGYLLFHPEIEIQKIERKKLESDLWLMIATETFELVLQPIVHASTGKPYALEALCRWRHETLGMISPDVFIPMAERNRQISRLDRAMLKRACNELAIQRQKHPDLFLSVNLSAITLTEVDIAGFIYATLHASGLPRNAFLLEITESSLSSDEARMSSVITTLKDLGIQILIDDFGTGYSSLSRLSSLPLDCVKIDKSFLADLEAGNQSLCKSIIHIAHSLHMQVIAEGVSNQEQLTLLIEMGCDFVQGYYLARPLDIPQLNAYMKTFQASEQTCIGKSQEPNSFEPNLPCI